MGSVPNSRLPKLGSRGTCARLCRDFPFGAPCLKSLLPDEPLAGVSHFFLSEPEENQFRNPALGSESFGLVQGEFKNSLLLGSVLRRETDGMVFREFSEIQTFRIGPLHYAGRSLRHHASKLKVAAAQRYSTLVVKSLCAGRARKYYPLSEISRDL
jgi:hypothetical protein